MKIVNIKGCQKKSVTGQQCRGSVGSLNPELKWEPGFEGQYDIIVYEFIEIEGVGKKQGRGKP